MKFIKKIILFKSLAAIFCTGLFASNLESTYISNEKNSKLLLKPIDGLSNNQTDIFILGRSFFNIPWVKAPSVTTARDGLGPLFNANSCISCHPNNGRGELFTKENLTSRALIARLSINSDNSFENKEILKKKGFIPEPVYGEQLAINGNFGVPFEGNIKIDFEDIEVKFPDGETIILQKPKYSLENLNYGKLHKNSVVSYRIAQSLNGMALIDLIENEEILKNQDINDTNNDGIKGKANFVYSPISEKYELGKYTWKASVAKLKEQVAFAASNDIGLTTAIEPNKKCTSFQKECLEAPKAKDKIDLPDDRLEAITYYLKNLKTYSANKNTKEYKDGFSIFEELSCSKCHISSFKTKLGFEISPFSDFLLHDMGEDLSDGRVEFSANEKEWRTAPLWGLTLHEKITKNRARLLHDGRAKNFEEAILWHGGEATQSREAYMSLEKAKREKLIKFLEEL
ncbi:di-heme oxidoredictase family protein [Aliarcobacter trophiarum]|uniref:Diheme oxidoreductase, putative peroxidase n=1 Tax=Aliarcobacter trophiarum LMG 25534 TaxID=1032241 RepID=A0AAD0QJA5_9BACT|nr:di-heme oxidoredictase family protein [Aliarcobacter trophiarum]AXK48488.1 diheme oxidoreductase, putative peroxidase [Aliarcobacter trophiarum LMG 25534]